MKIATFNCNSVRARMPVITRWLTENSPDILALQEIKVETEKFPHEPLEALGYHCEVRGKKGHAGVATISKVKPDSAMSGFEKEPDPEDSRILTCRWGKLTVINTYVPQGRDMEHEQFRYKLEWLERFHLFLNENFTKRRQVIWLGDFNVAPEPIDVYDSKRIMGHVSHNPVVFEALTKVRGWGFTDLFRKFHPGEEGQYTYFDYRFPGTFENNRGWRVDHIYVTNSLAETASACYIDREPRGWEKASDHTFLVAEIDL